MPGWKLFLHGTFDMLLKYTVPKVGWEPSLKIKYPNCRIKKRTSSFFIANIICKIYYSNLTIVD